MSMGIVEALRLAVPPWPPATSSKPAGPENARPGGAGRAFVRPGAAQIQEGNHMWLAQSEYGMVWPV
jgi:hypothetical protein